MFSCSRCFLHRLPFSSKSGKGLFLVSKDATSWFGVYLPNSSETGSSLSLREKLRSRELVKSSLRPGATATSYQMNDKHLGGS